MLASVIALLLLVSFSINAQEKSSDKEHAHKKEMVKKEAKTGIESAEVVNTVCPVSGEELEDNEHTIKHEGKTYAVCCKKCLAKIQKDPEKYISRLSEDGKSLKKS